MVWTSSPDIRQAWRVLKWYIFQGLSFFEILGKGCSLGWGLYLLGGPGTFWSVSCKQLIFYFLFHKDLMKILFTIHYYPFLLVLLSYMPKHSHSHTGLILLIAWNLSCYLYFAFCFFVWFIKLKCVPKPSHY